MCYLLIIFLHLFSDVALNDSYNRENRRSLACSPQMTQFGKLFFLQREITGYRVQCSSVLSQYRPFNKSSLRELSLQVGRFANSTAHKKWQKLTQQVHQITVWLSWLEDRRSRYGPDTRIWPTSEREPTAW